MGVSREDVVKELTAYNGWGDGSGYPGKRPNPACEYLGRPYEFSCGDWVTYAFKKAGLALPSMQAGCSTGYAYCPSAYNFAHEHNLIIPSWKMQPADILLINTGGGIQPGHTELGIRWANGSLFSEGGDSGGSNVDHFTHSGGTHEHRWTDPVGQGNASIMVVIDSAKLLALAGKSFGQEPVHHKPAASGSGEKLLMLKSPMMHSPLVREVQEALHKNGESVKVDGIYGVQTRDAVMTFQHKHSLHVDGVVGSATYAALGIK
jgi:hypothetical protein